MPGTKKGGIKARNTILKDNPNFYVEIGRKGGSHCGMKGFALNKELAREAGRKGGKISRRGKKHEDN